MSAGVIIHYFKFYVTITRNHSAFNSHNFPRPYTTTYLFSMLLCHINPWCLQIRKLPLTLAFFFVAVLTALFHAVFFLATRDWSLSMPFQLRALHDPLRDYSPPILPLCIQYIQPTCRDCRFTSLGVCGSDGTRTRAHGRVSCWLLHLPVFHCQSASRFRRE